MALGSYNEMLLRGASTSLQQIKAWLAGDVGATSLPAKPRIDDVDRFYIDNEDTTTGNALQVTSTITTSNIVDISAAALTTGKGIDLSNLNAITTGKALHIDATGITQTDGILVHVDSASTALTATGRLLLVDHTGASSVSGVIAEIKSAAADETTIVQINATAALALGVALDLSLAALTTGKGIDLSNLDAITTGKALHVDATGITQTDGILVHLDSASTALTATGRILLVDHTGASSVSGIIAEFKSAAADETTIVQVNATAALAAGVALDLSLAAMTSGKGIDLSNLDAITTGKALHIDATGITQTDGILVHVDSASTALTALGRLLLVDHTGASSVSGIIAEIKSAAADETTIAQINATAALALGVALDISLTAMTTGKGIDMSDLAALTTGKALHIDATGITQTDGILVHLDSASTALTATGRILLVDHTGASTVSGVIAEIKSAAADETVIAQINATAALALGVALDISLAAMTTGKGVDMSNLDAITTGKALHIDATGITQTDGILVHVDSASTALTATGRLLLVDHTGASSVSGIITEIKSAAADETVIAQILASGLLAAGKALNISAVAMTTGKAISIDNLDALTTGNAISITSNSADVTARNLVSIKNDNALATGTVGIVVDNDSTGDELQLIGRNTGALGAKLKLRHLPGNSQAADNDVVGRLLFQAHDEEAAATERVIGQIDCLWTDATAASFSSRFIVYTSTAAAQNEAMRILDDGSLSIDLSSGAGTALVFDDYDDAQLLSQWSLARERFLEKMCEIGIMERKPSGSGILLHVQKFMMLLAGGIYQNRQRIDAHAEELSQQIRDLQVQVKALKKVA